MRLRLLRRIIVVFFLFSILALVYYQIIRGTDYFRLSQNNRIKLRRLTAARGLIYDRQGRILVGHRLVFNVALLAQETRDVQQLLAKISPIVDIPENELLRQYKNNLAAPFVPVVVARDIPKNKAIILESKESNLPGLVIETEPLRDYRQAKSICHIAGYLGRIDEVEFKKRKLYGYQVRDLIGKSGIEKRFDHLLQGQAGGMQVEVNNLGYKVRVLGSQQPQAGSNIYLTIDAQLQNFVDQLMEEKKGACIVMDPQNGEILAMVSKPSFDPNLFIDALSSKPTANYSVRELLNAKDAPLINRAISAEYPPGSIFKIVVAVAGLESGIVAPGERFNCAGSFRVGNREFFCWNLDGHGEENICSALAHSCNVYFYKLALMLGVDKLTSFARKFGMGGACGIDLPYESTGFVPSKSWKEKVWKESWYDGDTANFSIGQGYLLVTPLQMVQMVSAAANGGYLVQPHLLKKSAYNLAKAKEIGLRKETLNTVKQGMLRALEDTHGTAHRANIPELIWAAKTGTAQTSYQSTHGWFGGFYPFDAPRIALVVFLEHGGSGGDVPAKIAKEIVKYIARNQM